MAKAGPTYPFLAEPSVVLLVVDGVIVLVLGQGWVVVLRLIADLSQVHLLPRPPHLPEAEGD